MLTGAGLTYNPAPVTVWDMTTLTPYNTEDSLLTDKDQRWLNFHYAMTKVRDWTLIEFEKYFLTSFEGHGITVIPADNPIVVEDLLGDDDCDCTHCDPDFDSGFYESSYKCQKELDIERRRFLEYCRPASKTDWLRWLKPHLEKKGQLRTLFKYDVAPTRNWYVLTEDVYDVPEMYGADSINLIVPKHRYLTPSQLTRTFHGNSGHNNIFFMDGYQVFGDIPENTEKTYKAYSNYYEDCNCAVCDGGRKLPECKA
jgi:hypothetical protein